MDPQLHTHALCINLTVHPDGRTTAVDSTYLYHFKMAAGAVYRAALAQGMQELGFSVEQRRSGSSIGFELACIPKALIEEFSQAAGGNRGGLEAPGREPGRRRARNTPSSSPRRPGGPRTPRSPGRELLGRVAGGGPRLRRRRRGTSRPGSSPYRKLTPEERDRPEGGDFPGGRRGPLRAAFPLERGRPDEGRRRAGRGPDFREGRPGTRREKLRGPELIHLGGLQTEQRNRERTRYIDRSEERLTTPEIKQQERQMLQAVHRICQGPKSESARELVEAAVQARRTLDPEQAEAVRYWPKPNTRVTRGKVANPRP